MTDQEKLSFEEARDRLRARGYLDRGVEGAVLKGALAARGRAASLVRGAAVAAGLLAVALAAAATVLGAVRARLDLRDAAVLFAWQLLAALLAALVLVGLLVAVAAWRLRGRSDAESVSLELGAAFGLLAGVGAVLAARPALEAAGAGAAAAVLLAVAAAVFLAVRVARGVAFTVLLAEGRTVLAGRRRAGVVALFLAVLVAGAALAASRRGASPAPEPLVVASSARRAVVVGVDGWSERFLPKERAALPGTPHPYVKPRRDPAAFWTSVATGEKPTAHGVGSLDLVLLGGMTRPVLPLPGTGWYLGGVLGRAGLSRREPATAVARRVPAAWEVAARAGIPALVVNWWTTYPSGESRATVLSNDLFFAARAGASLAGEGWPPEAAARAARLAPPPAAAGSAVERLVADATGLDAFAITAFREERRRSSPRLALLYLPGPDILAAALADPARSAGDRVVLATALTREAERVAAFLSGGELLEGADLLVLVLDGGRSEAGGEVRFAGPLARERGDGVEVSPLDLAPTTLAALGVPASREVAGRVRPELLRNGVATEATVASWGRRAPPSEAGVDSRAYVENLRSLGYLR